MKILRGKELIAPIRLTHFKLMFHFHINLKHQIVRCFLFPGGIEVEHWFKTQKFGSKIWRQSQTKKMFPKTCFYNHTDKYNQAQI